jgi:formylglycine-generating enzyme required for sulfatase activity
MRRCSRFEAKLLCPRIRPGNHKAWENPPRGWHWPSFRAVEFLIVICSLVPTTNKADSAIQVGTEPQVDNSAAPPGMVWIRDGEFTMGTDDVRSLPNEHPAHKVQIEGFWIDEHDVTNAE